MLEPAATTRAATSTISGHVMDPDGNPVAGVRVAAFQFNPDLGGWFSEVWTDTNAAGNYELTGLAAGVYRIGFIDATFNRYMTEYYDDVSTVESRQDIVLGDGITVSDINAVLTPLGHVQGCVTDLEGVPIQDIQATAFRFIPEMGGWFDYSFGITDANGHYDLRSFEPGTYRVRFIDGLGRYKMEFYDNATDIDSATDINVALSDIVTGIDAELMPLGKPSITIVKDAQPDNRRTFRFEGDLGKFGLKDSPSDDNWDETEEEEEDKDEMDVEDEDDDDDSDNDAKKTRKTNSISFEVDAGMYTIYERLPARWILADIVCNLVTAGTIDLPANQLIVTANGGDNITCTFVNRLQSDIRANSSQRYSEEADAIADSPTIAPFVYFPLVTLEK